MVIVLDVARGFSNVVRPYTQGFVSNLSSRIVLLNYAALPPDAHQTTITRISRWRSVLIGSLAGPRRSPKLKISLFQKGACLTWKPDSQKQRSGLTVEFSWAQLPSIS